MTRARRTAARPVPGALAAGAVIAWIGAEWLIVIEPYDLRDARDLLGRMLTADQPLYEWPVYIALACLAATVGILLVSVARSTAPDMRLLRMIAWTAALSGILGALTEIALSYQAILNAYGSLAAPMPGPFYSVALIKLALGLGVAAAAAAARATGARTASAD